MDPSGWATFWSAVAAVAAGISALLSAISTRLSFRIIQAQSEPNVIVYVHHDESRPSFLQIVIKNIGHGLASDIVFRPSAAIPHRAFGNAEGTARPAAVMTAGPLIEGIPLLAPGETRKMVWGQYGGLKEALGDRYITVVCNYSHGKRPMQTVSRLEVSSFDVTDANESDSARVIRQLQRIGDSSEATCRSLSAFLSRPKGMDGRET